MRKQKRMTAGILRYRAGAYLTVYLTLVMAILLSLFLVMVEGVRKNSFYLQAECVTDIALNSCLAEFHQELFRQYGLFAIDASYGTEIPDVKNTERHFQDYIEGNLRTEDIFLNRLFYRDFLQQKTESLEVTGVRLLTDQRGKIFRIRAAETVWNESVPGKAQQLLEWMKIVDSDQLLDRDVAAEKKAWDDKLQRFAKKDEKKDEKKDAEKDAESGYVDAFSTEGGTSPSIENPTDFLERKRKEGILKWVVKDAGNLSGAGIETEYLIGKRMQRNQLQKGELELEESMEIDPVIERVLFQEYLISRMGHYGKESQQDCLKYQIEYLIAGRNNDLDNLRSMANRLLAFREAANITYISTDEEMKAAAEILATALATLLEIPEAADVLKYILLYGWAFAESLYDVKCLLAGEKIPLMKDQQSWHYDLDTALGLDTPDSGGCNEGLCYEDYLRIFMYVQKEDVLTGRAMDMVEGDIRMTPGNEMFCLDGCIDAMEVSVNYCSKFHYDCNVTRQKGYSTQ